MSIYEISIKQILCNKKFLSINICNRLFLKTLITFNFIRKFLNLKVILMQNKSENIQDIYLKQGNNNKKTSSFPTVKYCDVSIESALEILNYNF